MSRCSYRTSHSERTFFFVRPIPALILGEKSLKIIHLKIFLLLDFIKLSINVHYANIVIQLISPRFAELTALNDDDVVVVFVVVLFLLPLSIAAVYFTNNLHFKHILDFERKVCLFRYWSLPILWLSRHCRVGCLIWKIPLPPEVIFSSSLQIGKQ